MVRDLSYGPCGEGGSLSITSEHHHKGVMILYSPSSQRQPMGRSSRWPIHAIITNYHLVIEMCMRTLWRIPFRLSAFAACISGRAVRPGFTSPRGVVVLPRPPPGNVARAPGFSCRWGHTLADTQKLIRSDMNMVLMPHVPFDHEELLIIIAVPLLLHGL